MGIRRFSPSTMTSWTLFVCFVECLMVLNATFNNISVISWWSVLLVEETRGHGENNDLSQVTDKLYYIILYTSLWSRFELTTSVAEQTGIPWEEKTADLWQVTDKHYQVMSYWLHFAMSGIRTHNISGDTDCTSSFKSNYHTITTTMTPLRLSC